MHLESRITMHGRPRVGFRCKKVNCFIFKPLIIAGKTSLKSFSQKHISGNLWREMLVITLPATLLQIFHKIILDL